ncbi:sporulation integral membrane protein YtvI [Thalassobacillus sp. CUG 92003]|uniref:sporulation integral membrane protein YtvI n=1 Tax=Thalassobacillus sp. CUG 92003 TaxID=2736641 RepID=UPI0015E78246|nr:sporulation integral membrane protein YtvI [Thalassobacillus sp. CUG 92003]
MRHELMWARLFIVCTVTVVASLTIYALLPLLHPFLWAFFIAWIINPLVKTMQWKWNFPRWTAVITALSLCIVFLFSLSMVAMLEIINGTTYLAHYVPSHFGQALDFVRQVVSTHVTDLINSVTQKLGGFNGTESPQFLKQMDQLGMSLTETGTNFLKNVLEQIPVLLSQLPASFTFIMFVLLGVFFISKDWDTFNSRMTSLFPGKLIVTLEHVVNDLKKTASGYAKAQFLLIMITACLVVIGLWILDVNHGLTIALLTGVVDIIPYLGTGIIFIPWIGYLFLSGEQELCIGIAILYLTIVIMRQLLEPKLLSQQIGLHPLFLLIAMFSGFQLAGFLGLLLGPVTLIVVKSIHRTGATHELWNYIKYGPHSS